jgi:hypothetical protein
LDRILLHRSIQATVPVPCNPRKEELDQRREPRQTINVMTKDAVAASSTDTLNISVFDFPYLKFLLLIWLVYLVIFFLCVLFTRNKKHVVINLIIGFGIISLGFVTGAIMGNNRNPISDSVMSSVFTLLGGIVVYMFAQKNTENSKTNKTKEAMEMLADNENKFLVALVLILFPVSLLYGSHVGASFRLQNDTYSNNLSYNKQLSLDSLEIWKKTSEANIDENKTNRVNYNDAMYKTWSENEMKRYEKQLNSLKKTDTIPAVPDYLK